MCHYLCHMETECSCNVTPVVQKDANMVVRMSGSIRALSEVANCGVLARFTSPRSAGS